ncbi:MAG: hypothetical protein WD355_10045 [Balneolaceae bacterium]
MDEVNKKKNEILDELEEKKVSLENAYEELVDKLRGEKDRLENDLRHEYRSARRYVRANPEQGVGIAVAGGLLIGFILGKLSR